MSSWIITSKPSFQTEWLLIPKQENSQIVLSKIAILAQDPRPDNVFKKPLPDPYSMLYCIRAGTYRLFYTFELPYIRLLALRLREQENIDNATLDDLSLDESTDVDGELAPGQEINWHTILTKQGQLSLPLPKTISVATLDSLHVPPQYHSHLLSAHTQKELLNCHVPQNIIQRIKDALWMKPITEILDEPNYVVKDGNLAEFLLCLDTQQEQAARRALDGHGPTQVKGQPGTGKSIVALYRIRYLLERLPISKQPEPRILFTTYTNPLVNASRSLLKQLLGVNIKDVKICTADSIILDLFRLFSKEYPRIAKDGTLSKFTKNAVECILPSESIRQEFLSKLSYDYLLEEVLQVIQARKVTNLEEYLKLKRSGRGRRVRLSSQDRATIWHIYEQLQSQLQANHQETWQQVRLRAEALLTAHPDFSRFDAVVIDEAQDLDPSVLRILFKVCRTPNGFYITADANQTIYGRGFSWQNVDTSLNFQGGRTTTLTTNYRSTREIAEAAHSYLIMGAAAIDAEETLAHVRHGPQPAIRMMLHNEEEYQSLATFLFNAMETLHFGLSMCAVLCPTSKSGKAIAAALRTHGIPARFFPSQELNLDSPEVKVLTLHSSKGLEFPIVALAGFRGSRYAQAYDNLSEDEQAETITKHRRLLFVGMTRAMRMLLVLIPAEATSPVLTGFDAAYWNSDIR